MEFRPTALVVSDFPILARSLEALFRHRYRVVLQGWSGYSAGATQAAFVIFDTTSFEAEAVNCLLGSVPKGVRAATCSLHRNEVSMYQMAPDGLAAQGEVWSLLALPASGTI